MLYIEEGFDTFFNKKSRRYTIFRVSLSTSSFLILAKKFLDIVARKRNAHVFLLDKCVVSFARIFGVRGEVLSKNFKI